MSQPRAIQTGVILAAGMGTRLNETHAGCPKGFIQIQNETLVKRSISLMRRRGIERIVIGTGFRSESYEELREEMGGIVCVKNDAFASSGSLHTLVLLRDVIESDFLLLESDLVYEERALDLLLDHMSADVMLASGPTESGDEVFLERDRQGCLLRLSKDKTRLESVCGEFVGMSKLSVSTYRRLVEWTRTRSEQPAKIHYEEGLAVVSRLGSARIQVCLESDLVWGEIDTADHLRRVEETVYPAITRIEAHALH